MTKNKKNEKKTVKSATEMCSALLELQRLVPRSLSIFVREIPEIILKQEWKGWKDWKNFKLWERTCIKSLWDFEKKLLGQKTEKLWCYG